MVKLFAQFALVDQISQPDMFGPVDQGERNLRVGFVAEHGLTHQQFVEIRINERPHNRVDFPFVIPNAGGNIDHRCVPLALAR